MSQARLEKARVAVDVTVTISWVLYLSRPTVPPWPSTILDIARASERANPEAGVTGLLLFSTQAYLHYLEGPAAPLSALRARIAADNRHQILWTVGGEVEARRMPGLSQGYFDAEHERAEISNLALWMQRYDWRPDHAEALAEMLAEIARRKYPTTLGTGAAG